MENFLTDIGGRGYFDCIQKNNWIFLLSFRWVFTTSGLSFLYTVITKQNFHEGQSVVLFPIPVWFSLLNYFRLEERIYFYQIQSLFSYSLFWYEALYAFERRYSQWFHLVSSTPLQVTSIAKIWCISCYLSRSISDMGPEFVKFRSINVEYLFKWCVLDIILAMMLHVSCWWIYHCLFWVYMTSKLEFSVGVVVFITSYYTILKFVVFLSRFLCLSSKCMYIISSPMFISWLINIM